MKCKKYATLDLMQHVVSKVTCLVEQQYNIFLQNA